MTIGLIAGTGFENFDAMMVENSLTLSTPCSVAPLCST